MKKEELIVLLGKTMEKDDLTAEERRILRGTHDLLTSAPESAPNINEADWPELMAATGIGVTRCKAIVDFRDSTGQKFDTPTDLLKVRNIGIGVAAKLVGKVRFS